MELDETFAGLARESGPRLLRLAYQLTHDRAAAEDVVQEALMRMYTSWRRRTPQVDDLGAYARQSVVNEFLRRQRKREARELVIDTLPEHHAQDATDTVVDRDAMWTSLATLPTRQRTVLVLRYYEDLPDDEIARLIDARPATVRSLAARGLATLRAAQPVRSEQP